MLCFPWAQIGTGAKLSPKAPRLPYFGRDLGFHSSDPFDSSFGVRFGHEIAQQLSTSWAYLVFYLGFYLRPNFGARCPHTGPSWVCWVQLARAGRKLSLYKLGPSWPTSRQGLPILTPRLLFVPNKPRFSLLCPIPWVRALLVVKRLEYQFVGAFVYIHFCCVLFFWAR